MKNSGDDEISQGRLRAAWGIAFLADLLQIVFFPFFLAGAASPLDDVLDVVVAGTLTALVGWHWSFLPSFLVKLTPGIDLVPTWSAAMLLARRKAVFPKEPQKVVVEPPKRLSTEAPLGPSPSGPAALPAAAEPHEPGAAERPVENDVAR